MTAFEMGLKIGSVVKRKGDDGKYYEYEVTHIDEDGYCIDIENDDAWPSFEYIMADDCEVVKL